MTALAGAEAADLHWFTPAGAEMTGGDWSVPSAPAIALYLDGADDPDRAADGAGRRRAHVSHPQRRISCS